MNQMKIPFQHNRGRILDSLLILIGFLIIGSATLAKLYFPDKLPLRLDALALIITLVLWGIVGLLWVIRREVYQFVFKIEGTLAVLWGLGILISCWGGALYLLLKYFF
jgi:hypothetical protein